MASSSSSSSLSSDSLDASMKKFLTCPGCQKIFEPPVFLCAGGHSLCLKCSKGIEAQVVAPGGGKKVVKCPLPACGKPVTETRNLQIEEVIESVVGKKCPYAKDGCTATCATPKSFDKHVAKCQFKPVVCDMLQVKSCFNVNVSHRNYLTHLQNIHGVTGVKGSIINVTQFVSQEQSRLVTDMPRGMWPVQYLEAFNENFLTGTEVFKKQIFWWMYIIGNQAAADKFICKVTLTLKSKGVELTWVGPVHSFRTSPNDIRSKGLCLLASSESLAPFVYSRGDMEIGEGTIMDNNSTPPSSNINMGWDLQFAVLRKEKVLKTENNSNAAIVQQSRPARAPIVEQSRTQPVMPNGNEIHSNLQSARVLKAASPPAPATFRKEFPMQPQPHFLTPTFPSGMNNHAEKPYSNSTCSSPRPGPPEQNHHRFGSGSPSTFGPFGSGPSPMSDAFQRLTLHSMNSFQSSGYVPPPDNGIGMMGPGGAGDGLLIPGMGLGSFSVRSSMLNSGKNAMAHAQAANYTYVPPTNTTYLPNPINMTPRNRIDSAGSGSTIGGGGRPNKPKSKGKNDNNNKQVNNAGGGPSKKKGN